MLSCIRISVGQLEAWSRLRLSRDLLCWDWKRKIHISAWRGEGEEIKQATRQHLTRITCHSGKLCGKLCSCGSPFALINFSVAVPRAKTSPEQSTEQCRADQKGYSSLFLPVPSVTSLLVLVLPLLLLFLLVFLAALSVRTLAARGPAIALIAHDTPPTVAGQLRWAKLCIGLPESWLGQWQREEGFRNCYTVNIERQSIGYTYCYTSVIQLKFAKNRTSLK